MVNFAENGKTSPEVPINGKNVSTMTFHPVKDPTVLIKILLERLPVSSMMHNQVIMYKKHQDCLRFYTLGSEITANTWIVSNNVREDYGCHYGISAPVAFALGDTSIPTEITEAFASSEIFDWQHFSGHPMAFFVQTPQPIANMIYEISTNLKGNITEVHPCRLFTMSREAALKLTVEHSPDVQIRRLLPNKQDADFILSTWKYTLPGSENVVMKCLERNASAGVFVDKGTKCVCGVYIPAMGHLSALYTLKEYRNKGYAKVTMKYAFREFAHDGCIPCLTVEMQNPRSIRFHEGLGMTLATMPVNFLIVKKLDID